MKSRFLHIFFLFLASILMIQANGQVKMRPGWDAEKIKGVRNVVYPFYKGTPFLIDKWVMGKIEFADGEVADSISLRYSSYKDELIYFNQEAGAQIVIDKDILKGFSFIDTNGKLRKFRKQYYDNYLKADRYFEILSEGKVDVLSYRKVNLITTFAYKDENGVLKNMEYLPEYLYYIYSPTDGYEQIRMNRESLLSKFEKTSQKPIRKLLRKQHITVSGEESFVRAWKAVEQANFKVVF